MTSPAERSKPNRADVINAIRRLVEAITARTITPSEARHELARLQTLTNALNLLDQIEATAHVARHGETVARAARPSSRPDRPQHPAVVVEKNGGAQ